MQSDPKDWKTPKWHPDYGDPEIEIDMLRNFCISLLERYPSLKILLDCYEEGYISVDVIVGERKFFEIQIVEGENSKRYGIFYENSEGDESYFDDIDSGVQDAVTRLKMMKIT